jgi:hypothetical protein
MHKTRLLLMCLFAVVLCLASISAQTPGADFESLITPADIQKVSGIAGTTVMSMPARPDWSLSLEFL